MTRVSPAQLPAVGVNGVEVGDPNVLVGKPSFWQPLLLANGDPYPPMPVVLNDVVVVAGTAVVVEVAGIAGVFVTVMLS